MKMTREIAAILLAITCGCTSYKVAVPESVLTDRFTGVQVTQKADGGRFESSYSNGILNGPTRWYDEDGGVVAEFVYNNGKKHGPYFWEVQHHSPVPDGTKISGIYRLGKPWDGEFLEMGCEPAAFVVKYSVGEPIAPEWFVRLKRVEQDDSIGKPAASVDR